ncbi:hypothetical protein F5B22DRAFT_650556 [Xylaria bambusicola]|uniref:uncharacterized protein n=1 Tax=Xylaria bambusicola TaxID=326684 RepID=UPI0020083177|nr:uncharacterized protein F5B22DRAFT_650556 [Xylaria bambusicola]KAI0506594.1 hypothetical protein F5B22DRAFT_650556 [Xylaria bambusicola]
MSLDRKVNPGVWDWLSVVSLVPATVGLACLGFVHDGPGYCAVYTGAAGASAGMFKAMPNACHHSRGLFRMGDDATGPPEGFGARKLESLEPPDYTRPFNSLATARLV